MRGATLGEACRDIGVSYNHVRAVIVGDRVGSQQTERRIAGVMGLEHDEVFGDRRAGQGIDANANV